MNNQEEKRIILITAHQEYIDRANQCIGLAPVGILMYSNVSARAIKNRVSSEMIYISYN
jgi:lauroyl/myristoyl acyltransferase